MGERGVAGWRGDIGGYRGTCRTGCKGSGEGTVGRESWRGRWRGWRQGWRVARNGLGGNDSIFERILNLTHRTGYYGILPDYKRY